MNHCKPALTNNSRLLLNASRSINKFISLYFLMFLFGKRELFILIRYRPFCGKDHFLLDKLFNCLSEQASVSFIGLRFSFVIACRGVMRATTNLSLWKCYFHGLPLRLLFLITVQVKPHENWTFNLTGNISKSRNIFLSIGGNFQPIVRVA